MLMPLFRCGSDLEVLLVLLGPCCEVCCSRQQFSGCYLEQVTSRRDITWDDLPNWMLLTQNSKTNESFPRVAMPTGWSSVVRAEWEISIQFWDSNSLSDTHLISSPWILQSVEVGSGSGSESEVGVGRSVEADSSSNRYYSRFEDSYMYVCMYSMYSCVRCSILYQFHSILVEKEWKRCRHL